MIFYYQTLTGFGMAGRPDGRFGIDAKGRSKYAYAPPIAGWDRAPVFFGTKSTSFPSITHDLETFARIENAALVHGVSFTTEFACAEAFQYNPVITED